MALAVDDAAAFAAIPRARGPVEGAPLGLTMRATDPRRPGAAVS